MEKHSDRTAHYELSLSVIFLWSSVKAFYEKGKNLRDLPRLNQEARGYSTVPNDNLSAPHCRLSKYNLGSPGSKYKQGARDD